MWSRVVVAGICPPLPPSFTIWSLTVMMKHDYISKTDNVGHQQSDSAQGPPHCLYLNDNISRVIQAAVKN